MLRDLAAECKAISDHVHIIDDGSEYQHTWIRGATIHVFEHGGKPLFWNRWDHALKLASESQDDFFLFLPDDYSQIDFDGIHEFHRRQSTDNPYICNVANDGRGPQWTTAKQVIIDEVVEWVGWTDCSFFCNRAALEAIGFGMLEVPASRFRVDNISSGVGQQLTQRFNRAGVPMYRPFKSFAFHGDHESVMHPEERKRNPLITR